MESVSGDSVSANTITRTYDTLNRVTSYTDAAGNMTYGPLEGEMATFTYDCRNRLTEVTTDSGKTTQYQYDAENNRTAVIKNAGTTQETKTAYIVDSTSNELTRVLQATTVTKSGETERVLYTYGNGLIAQEKTEKLSNAETEVSNAVQTEVTDIVLAQNERKEYLLYHFNHIGSTTAVTDEAGAVKYTYTYSIYGELLSGNYGEVEFLYNGQYGVTSDDNGLYYMRARYYNIDIKRFINQDILTGSIDSSQSLNRYAYVEGNPVNYLDPFGLEKSNDDDSVDYIEVLIGLVLQFFGLDFGTISAGVVGNVSFGGIFGYSVQLGGTIDSKGNFALQVTMGFNVTTGAGASGGGYYSRTNATDLTEMQDETYSAGGTIVAEGGIGIDFNAIPGEDKTYYGITVAVLYGASAEVHGGYTTTTNIIRGNIYDIYRKYIKKKFNN